MTARSLPRIGMLTDRVQFQRREMAREDEGGHVSVYVPVKTLWSRVRPLSARAMFDADGRGAAGSHVVVTRFRPDVKPGDRFVYRGRDLEVMTAEDMNGRRTWLSCLCHERAVTG